MTLSGKFHYELSNQLQIPFTFELESLHIKRSPTTELETVEAIQTIRAQFQGIPYVVQRHYRDIGGAEKDEYYLNGTPIKKEVAESLVGGFTYNPGNQFRVNLFFK